MEPGELIFIETSGEDAPSTLMLVVNTKREEGYVLFGRLIPAVRREMGSLGQWMQVQGESRVPEYKLVRASMAHLLEEAVRVLMQEGWSLHEGTVFHQGKYLQWMFRWPVNFELRLRPLAQRDMAAVADGRVASLDT